MNTVEMRKWKYVGENRDKELLEHFVEFCKDYTNMKSCRVDFRFEQEGHKYYLYATAQIPEDVYFIVRPAFDGYMRGVYYADQLRPAIQEV